MLFFKNTPIPTCLIVFILQPFTLNYLPGNQPPFHVLPLHIRNRATLSLFIIWIFTQLYNIIEIHDLHSIFIFQHNSIICNFFYYSISSSIACLPTASGRLNVLYCTLSQRCNMHTGWQAISGRRQMTVKILYQTSKHLLPE